MLRVASLTSRVARKKYVAQAKLVLLILGEKYAKQGIALLTVGSTSNPFFFTNKRLASCSALLVNSLVASDPSHEKGRPKVVVHPTDGSLFVN